MIAALPARAQMIKWKQAGMHMESFGMDLTNPDFVAHAESMGARGHRLTSVRGLLGEDRAAIAGRDAGQAHQIQSTGCFKYCGWALAI